jgi:hypothetical protein
MAAAESAAYMGTATTTETATVSATTATSPTARE